MTYNVGDRVVLTKTTDALPGVPLGSLGTLGELRDPASVHPFRVRWDANPTLGWYPDKGALVRSGWIRLALAPAATPIDPALRERMLVLALEHGWVDPDVTAARWAAFITTGATS